MNAPCGAALSVAGEGLQALVSWSRQLEQEPYVAADAGVVRRIALARQSKAERHLIASISIEETIRLKALNDTEPSGVLAVSDDLDPDRTEGSELTYLHGVATTDRPDGLDTIEVPAGTWAVFRTDRKSVV